ncbi:nitrous oxide reductase accessory protein NosL [Castellaniella caeni]
MKSSSVTRPFARGPHLVSAIVVAISLGGCMRHDPIAEQKPVDIQKNDTCAVCGMYLKNAPGPRAEAYVKGRKQPLKFDSTRDFFAYALQPEHRAILQHQFVQDCAKIDWNHPSDAADSFTDAQAAYYVAWQPLAGAMGPTLASFAQQGDATRFVQQYGGRIVRYTEITPQMISLLGTAQHQPHMLMRSPKQKQ